MLGPLSSKNLRKLTLIKNEISLMGVKHFFIIILQVDFFLEEILLFCENADRFIIIFSGPERL